MGCYLISKNRKRNKNNNKRKEYNINEEQWNKKYFHMTKDYFEDIDYSLPKEGIYSDKQGRKYIVEHCKESEMLYVNGILTFPLLFNKFKKNFKYHGD